MSSRRAACWPRSVSLLALLLAVCASVAPLPASAQTVTPLQSGVFVSGSLLSQKWAYYSLSLIPGASLSIFLEAVSGYPYVYVSDENTPTRDHYDWRAWTSDRKYLDIYSATFARDLIIGVYASGGCSFRLRATRTLPIVVIAYGTPKAVSASQGYSYYQLTAPSGSEDVLLTLSMSASSAADLYVRNNEAVPSVTSFTWSSSQPLNSIERILMSSPAAARVIVAVYVTSASADFSLVAERRPHLPLLTANIPLTVSGSDAAPSRFYFTADGSSSLVVSVSAQYPASTQILIITPTSAYSSVGAGSSDASSEIGATSLLVSGALLMPGPYTIAVLTAPGTAVNSLSIRVSTMPLSPVSGSYLTLPPSLLETVPSLSAGSRTFYSLTVDLPSGVSTDLTVTLQAQTGHALLFVRHINASAWQGMGSTSEDTGSAASVLRAGITSGTYIIGAWALSNTSLLWLTGVAQSASPQLLLSDSRHVWTAAGSPAYLYLDLLSARQPVTLSISDTSLTDTFIYVSTPASTSPDGSPRPSNSSSDAMLTATGGQLTLSGALLMPGRYWLAVTTRRLSALVQLTITAGTFQGTLTSLQPVSAELMPELPAVLWSSLVPKGHSATFTLMTTADAIRAAQMRLAVGSSVAPPLSSRAAVGLRVLAESSSSYDGSVQLRVDRSAEDTDECMRLTSPPHSDGCLYMLEVSGLTAAGGSMWSGDGGSTQLPQTSLDYNLTASFSEANVRTESHQLTDASERTSLTFDSSASLTRTLSPGRTHHYLVLHSKSDRLVTQAHVRVQLAEASGSVSAYHLAVHLQLNASQSQPAAADASSSDFTLPAYGHRQLRLTLSSDADSSAATAGIPATLSADHWRVTVTNRNPSSVTYSIRISANDSAWDADDISAASQGHSHAHISLLMIIALAFAATFASFSWP